MDINTAIQDLKKFREKYGVSRDKAIEIYNKFKFDRQIQAISEFINGNTVNINRDEFWDNINTTIIRDVYSVKNATEQDLEEIKIYNTKLRKEKLKANDKLLFERKSFTKQLREINSLEELNREFIEELKKIKPIVHNQSSDTYTNQTNSDVLVVHIGDWHIGEQSAEFRDTGFDIEIANKRLKKLADYVKSEVKQKGIKKIVIMCGGDICNNVTLLCKRLNQTSNRAVTTIMAVILLQWFILDLYEVCKNISFAGVGNNESRYDEDYFEDEYLITNCADYVVYNMLELLFEDFKTIKFLQGRNCEKVVSINDQNILLTHGVTLGKGDVEKGIQQMISRYAVKGVEIRYVLCSHIHCARNSSYFARNGSLSGGNAYSNTTLNLQTRASQNIVYISKNGDINPIAVDLENVQDVKGYDISKEIEKFDLKPRDKRTSLDEIQIA